MKAVGILIDKLEKNHEKATPYMIALIIILCAVAIYCIPSYGDYCKEPQAQCKEQSK